jgi:3-keto-disaccharide hydrolase
VELMRALFVFLLTGSLAAADWQPLLNGRNLDGWEVIGDGQWTVMADGTLLGQRIGDYRKMLAPGGPLPALQQFKGWIDTQSWLYTKREDFGEFDLHVEYWTKTTGNSGVSIRDTSRAKWGVITPPDYKRTPSKIGYEIQINNRFPDPHPSGSIYGFMDAPKDAQHDDDWNVMEISSRNQKIAITLNGRLVAEHAGDPQRPKVGPIGLQLHDQFSIVMFRNLRIRENRPN